MCASRGPLRNRDNSTAARCSTNGPALHRFAERGVAADTEENDQHRETQERARDHTDEDESIPEAGMGTGLVAVERTDDFHHAANVPDLPVGFRAVLVVRIIVAAEARLPEA